MGDTIRVATLSRAKTRTRSTNGCWTCRVRRKKCDERSPECLTCLSLHLQCAGYGGRPSWMDGGEKEKQKAQEIKIEVNKWRRRGRHKSTCSRNSVSDQSSCQWSDHGSASPANVGSGIGDQVHTDLGLFTMLPTPDDRDIPFCDSNSPSVMVSPNMGNDHGGREAADKIFWDSLSCPTSWPSTDQSLPGPMDDASFAVTFDRRSADTPGDVFLNSIISSPAPLVEALSIAPHVQGTEAMGAVWRTQEPQTSTSCFEVATPFAIEDDSHLEHYCQHIIPSIFPFLSRQLQLDLDERLMNTPKHDSLLRFSTLMHCTAIRRIGLEIIGLAESASIEGGNYNCRPELLNRIKMAMEQNYRDHAQTTAEHDIDVALAVMQAILMQIRQGQSDYGSLALLMEATVSRHRPDAVPADVLTSFAYSFVLTTDILWTASKRRRPLLTSNPSNITLLGRLGPELSEALTGCESWVLQRIAEVNLLRLWKNDCLTSQSLNVAQLVKKATKLEEATQEQQAALLSSMTYYKRKDIFQLTNIYACAVRIYLHVVVSDAHPEVSDIREAVAATINAVKQISHATLLRRLAWPVCVAASLAEPKHDAFFNRLEHGANADQDGCFNVLRALRVARECRRLRESSSDKSSTFDWVDAQDSLGYEWILF